MTTATVHLYVGENYISFPLKYESNFRTLFTESGVIHYIDRFEKVDPISNNYIPVDLDAEYTEEGRGYRLITKINSYTPPIIYVGKEYTIFMTFDILRSMLLKGWNLIGPGSSAITIPKWCIARDPKTFIPVTQLGPTKAYLINTDECTSPTTQPLIIIFGLGLVVSIISLWYSLKRTEKIEADEII